MHWPERSGLISQVSALMIEQIGEDLGEWLSRRPAQRLAINIAPSELSDPALIDHIAEHLIERGGPTRADHSGNHRTHDAGKRDLTPSYRAAGTSGIRHLCR